MGDGLWAMEKPAQYAHRAFHIELDFLSFISRPLFLLDERRLGYVVSPASGCG
jgi:hypothetical protein